MQAGTSTGLGLFRQSLRIGVVLGCLALFHQVATADELTDALIRYALQDYAHAIALLAPLADRGNVVAQMQLGLIYARGEGVLRDDVTALNWLTRAAEQGQSEAQFEVGVMHRDGLGTPIDGMQALKWFERAAERGVPHAFNAIGEMYLGHRDVAQDYKVALVWFVRGAQLDNADALYNIGVSYALGQGVERDDIEAYKWFDLAADAGLGEVRNRAVRARQATSERLMPLQVSQAKIRAQDWLRTQGTESESLKMPIVRNRPDRPAALARHRP